MTRGAPLRIGLVVDAARVERHLDRFVDAVCRQIGARPVVLVTRGGGGGADRRRALATGAIDAAATALLRIEQVVLRGLGRLSRSVARRAAAIAVGRVDVSARFETHVVLSGTAVDATRVPDVDVMLVLGSWIPEASRLATGRAEWIQLELGEAASSGSAIRGFVEADEGRDGTAVALHRLDRDTRRRSCLVDGLNRTRPLFSLNQAALWGRAVSLTVACLAGGRADPSRSEPVPDAVPGVRPGVLLARLAVHPARLAWRGARIAWTRLRSPTVWRVAAVSDGAARDGGCRLSFLPEPPRGRWHADPMLHRDPRTGRVYCFVEEFDPAVGHAHIAALEHDGRAWRHVGPALVEPFHLSFPFLFEHEGQLYMLPETGAANAIHAYRCDEMPLRWTRVATLMEGVSATDTMVFARGGRWWMLTNIDRAPVPDHQSELHAFFADSPLSPRWTPVAGNPVNASCIGARNGGLVERDGELFRIGQVQSFERYGKQLNVYRVARLDEGGYEEVEVAQLAPPACRRADAIHTFVTAPGWRVVDIAVPASLPGGPGGAVPCAGAGGCRVCGDDPWAAARVT